LRPLLHNLPETFHPSIEGVITILTPTACQRKRNFDPALAHVHRLEFGSRQDLLGRVGADNAFEGLS
jgi:hypothetical protein